MFLSIVRVNKSKRIFILLSMEDSRVLGGNQVDKLLPKNKSFEEKNRRNLETRDWLSQIEMELQISQIYFDIFDPSEDIVISEEEYISPVIIWRLVLARDSRFFEKNEQEKSAIVKNQIKQSLLAFFKDSVSAETKLALENTLFEQKDLAA